MTVLSCLVGAAHGQETWKLVVPASGHASRNHFALAYDAARARLVVFGGTLGPGRQSGETWEWDGTGWTLLAPATAPSPRGLLAMAYDTNRGRTVMFGGYGATGSLADTWEWDGTNWLQIPTPVQPPARDYHAMAFDSRRGRVVLFGGGDRASFAGCLGDTWEWDGTSWQQHSRPVSPSPRVGHAMAYDARRGVTVLFGGATGCRNTPMADTWEWDGTVWTERRASRPPSARYDLGMAFDTIRGRTVVFGGYPAPLGPDDADHLDGYTDTWEWDGSEWSPRFPVVAPSRRWGHRMAFFAVLGRMVSFGGLDPVLPRMPETWELAVPCDPTPPGHPGRWPLLSCTQGPRIGAPLCLAFPSPFGLGIVAVGRGPCQVPGLPVHGPLCAPGFVYVVPGWVFAANGSPATLCVPLPMDPGLLGAGICAQGFALEGTGCLRATNGLTLIAQ